jgi:hypothetical protein
MPDSNASTFDTIQSIRGIASEIRQPRRSDSMNRMPAPVDQMILRALLNQPLVTAGEAKAAAEHKAANPQPFPFSISGRSN